MRIHQQSNDAGDVFRSLVTDSGSLYGNLECRRKAEQATRAFERWFQRTLETATVWADPDFVSDDAEQLGWVLDDLERVLRMARSKLEAREGVQREERKIAALRQTAGRSPDEAATYLAKADELERALRGE